MSYDRSQYRRVGIVRSDPDGAALGSVVDGMLVSCSAVKCVYSDTPAFEQWFLSRYCAPEADGE